MRLLFLFAFPLSAAITNFVVEPLSTQAVIRYNSGTASACTIQLSLSSGLSPLLPQVDTAKFTNGNSDAQFSYLASGQNRVFIAGQQRALRGTVDGISYSLALPESSLIYGLLACSASTQSFSFSTRPAPLGKMYIDPVQADSTNPGEMLSPSINFASRQFYTDPQTGVQFQPITLPHDITGWGIGISPHALTNAAVAKSGAGWSGSNFPYTITSDAASGLVFEASGLIGWPSYPFNSNAASYNSSVGGNLNWAQWVVVGHSSNAGCPGLGAQCQIQMCMSENLVSCDPWSPVYPCTLSSTNTTCTFGTTSTANQGGWASAMKRFRNGPETAIRNAGSVTCNGTTTVVFPANQPTDPLWVNGTAMTINGTGYLLASVVDEQTVTLQSTCAAGSLPYSISGLSWIITAVSSSADTLTVSSATSQWELGFMPSWPDAGYWGLNSQNLVNAAGGLPSYLFQIQPGQGAYATNATTGATALIGPTLVNSNGVCVPNSATWDTRTNVTTQYCLYATVYANQMFAISYTPTTWADLGNLDNTNQDLCSFNAPPCWTQTNMTSGTSIDALAAAFDPTFLGSSKGISCGLLVGMNQLNHLVINCWAGNSTRGYISIFDPVATTNGQPGNAGCIGALLGNSNPGCIIAQVATFLAAPAKGNAMKGDIRPDVGPGIIMWQPQPNSGSANGQGPWQVNMTGTLSSTPTTCPSNPYGITGANCTLITVSGEPYDPTPGPNETGLPGEYITAAAGDYVSLTNNSAVNSPPTTEVLRILIKNSPTSWWVQRGVTRDTAFCTPPAAAYTCGAGSAPQTSAASPVIYYSVTSGEMMWQYQADPLGANIQAYNYDSTSHRATHNGQDLDSSSINGATGGNWPPCVFSSYANGGCMGARNAATTPALLGALTSGAIFSGSTPLFPQFNSVASVVGANPVQFHPANGGANGTVDSLRYSDDARPFNGLYAAGGQPCSATNVSGSLWKVAAGCNATSPSTGLHRKIFPTKAQWGWHPLLDVSPATVSTSANYTYCVVNNSGDCHAASSAGEIYFSVPYLSTPYCFFPTQAGQAADTSDVCILDNNPMLDTLIEVPNDDPSDRAQRQRVLTHGFSPSKVNAPFWTLNSMPNNLWYAAAVHFFGSVRTDGILIKRSVEEQDSIDRTNYQTPAIPVPKAPGSAVVEWGYLEYGSDGLTHFYCTSRADNCRTLASPSLTVPFKFASETQSPTSCSSGCTVSPSFIPDRVVIWRILRTDGSGNVTAAGQTNVTAVR